MAYLSCNRWLLAGALFFAGAYAPVVENTALASGWDVPSATSTPEEVLGFGLKAISDKYLDDVALSSVALTGLNGLSKTDPDLAAIRQNSSLIISIRGEQIARYSVPKEHDAKGWARIMGKAMTQAMAASPKLQALDREAVYKIVFDASLASLDRFSHYAGQSEARDKRAQRNGFGGIGIRFEPTEKSGIRITETIPGGPAELAGIRTGDIVTHIDGHSVIGLDYDQISVLLRGMPGSEVTLTASNTEGGVQTATLRRTLVVPPTVSIADITNGIAVIKIASFNQKTGQGLKDAVITAQRRTALKGVVLDLRGNPGGLLDQAVEVADLFMDKGAIVSTRGRHPETLQSYSAQAGDIGEAIPLAVLIDGKSASAAEIVTSALQDSGRAVVVGTNSYGKGTVQTVLHMPNDGEMTLTWSRYYSPSGYALHGLGILPTICTSTGQAYHSQDPILSLKGDGIQKIAASLDSWRKSPITAHEEREKLRASCPSEKHDQAVIDVKIAQEVLSDPALYSRTLMIGAPTNIVAAPSSRAITQSLPASAQRE